MDSKGASREPSRSPPPPESERPAKRAKHNGSEEIALAATLPPDSWAIVMDYVPLSDVISLALTCREIYYDAIPLVTTLHIRKAKEMDCGLSRHFRDVRDIFIYSLVQSEMMTFGDDGEEEEDFQRIDFETCIRAASFLSNNFPKLERVFFGSRDSNVVDEVLVPYVSISGPVGDRKSAQSNMSILIDTLSAAFRCGALPQKLSIKGLCCVNFGYRVGDCASCQRACESFPIDSVTMFECERSSTDQIESDRSHDLEVCLRREKLEEIIQSRINGQDDLLARAKQRLLRLLGRGKRRNFRLSDGKAFYLVHYSERQIKQLDIVIKSMQLDVSTLTSSELNQAIIKSFTGNERCPNPSAYSCLLSQKSREHLKNELGLPLEDDDAEHFRHNALHLLERIVTLVKSGSSELRNECLSLLAKLVALKENPPLQEVITSGVLPALIDIVKSKYGIPVYARSSAARILASILMKEWSDHGKDQDDWPTMISNLVIGNQNHPSNPQIVDSKIISLIVQSTEEKAIAFMRSVSICLLSEMIDNLNGAHKQHQMELVVDAGAIPNIISYISENGEDKLSLRTLSSLMEIIKSSPGSLGAMFSAGIMDTMQCTMNKSIQLDHKWIEFVHTIIFNGNNPPPCQEIFKSGIIPCMLEAMKKRDVSTRPRSVDILSELLKCKGTGSSQSGIDTLVDAGAVPILVDCVCDFSKNAVKKALLALEEIADVSIFYRDKILEAGVMTSLVPKMKDKNSMQYHCLCLIFKIGRHGQNRVLVQEIVSLGLLSPVIELMATEDHTDHPNGVQRVLLRVKICTVQIVTWVLGEKMTFKSIDKMVDAGVVSNLVRFLECECSGKHGKYIVENSLWSLKKLAESLYSRGKWTTEIISCVCKSGVKYTDPVVIERWLTLVMALMKHGLNATVVSALVNCGAIGSLIELMKPENEASSTIKSLIVKVLAKMVVEPRSVALPAMAGAGVISTLALFLACDSINDEAVEHTAFILTQVAAHSSYCRNKIIEFGILTYACSDSKAKSSGVRKGWANLFFALTCIHEENESSVEEVINAGVVPLLVEMAKVEKDATAKSGLACVLKRVKPRFIKMKTSEIATLNNSPDPATARDDEIKRLQLEVQELQSTLQHLQGDIKKLKPKKQTSLLKWKKKDKAQSESLDKNEDAGNGNA